MEHNQRWLLAASGLVLVIVLAGWYRYAHDHQGVSTGTSTTAAVTTQQQFYRQFTKQYPALKPALDHAAAVS